MTSRFEFPATVTDYDSFMRWAYDQPYDKNACESCGGSGVVGYQCCNGYECSCHGMPIDFGACDDCDKGQEAAVAIRALKAQQQ